MRWRSQEVIHNNGVHVCGASKELIGHTRPRSSGIWTSGVEFSVRAGPAGRHAEICAALLSDSVATA